MVGILEHEDIGRDLTFPESGLDVLLLGETRDELGGSEWQQMFARDATTPPPRVDLDREKSLIDLTLGAYERRLIRSAHDISNGGLAVALAESSMDGVGCHVDLTGHADGVDAVALLFGERRPRDCFDGPRGGIRPREEARRAGDVASDGRRPRSVIDRKGCRAARTNVPEMAHIWRRSPCCSKRPRSPGALKSANRVDRRP
jgi:phosphoribosylformylglycinamidine synthase